MHHRFHIEFLAAFPVIVGGILPQFTDEEWNRITGPVSGLVISFLMLMVMVMFGRSRIKKDDARERAREAIEEARRKEDKEEREKRHRESMAQQDKLADKFESLHETQMKAYLEQAKAQLVYAAEHRNLHDLIKRSPCLSLQIKSEQGKIDRTDAA